MRRGSIASSRDFHRVLTTGRRARRDGLTVWATPGPDPRATSRVGLTVGKRAGNAVTRNRIKRRVRAAFADVDIADGFDVVTRADREVAGRNFQEMKADLVSALGAAGVGISE